MRRIVVFLLLFATIAVAAEVSVTRDMPESVDAGKQVTVTFTITPTGTLSAFDIADLMPPDTSISDWSVTGVGGDDIEYDSQIKSYGKAVYNGNHWKFPEFSDKATLSYTFTAPSSGGSYRFVGIWLFPGGYDTDTKVLSVIAPEAEEAPSEPEEAAEVPVITEEEAKTLAYVALVVLVLLAIGYYYYTRHPRGERKPRQPRQPKPKKPPKPSKPSKPEKVISKGGGAPRTYDDIKKVRLD